MGELSRGSGGRGAGAGSPTRPGGERRVSRRRGERGFVLLDVLAALAIAMIGISVFLGGLSSALRIAGRQGERVQHAVEQRNADAEAQEVTFPPA